MPTDDTIDVQFQAAFGEDGSLEVTETSVETSLDAFGVDLDHRERETRRDDPAASEFGIDDRPTVRSASDDGEQSKLFVDTEADQVTLDGETARGQCPYERE